MRQCCKRREEEEKKKRNQEGKGERRGIREGKGGGGLRIRHAGGEGVNGLRE